MKDLSADNVSAEISNFGLEYAIVSDIGKRRTENQDSFARAKTSSSHLFIVADGMGGARGGATASALAVNIVGRKAFSSDGVITADSLKKALELANHVVHAFGTRDEELAGMGTTVVAFAITGDEVVIGFVGDSRIYFWRDDQITQVSRDHTLVQELVDSGALAEHEATNHPISHMLTRSLGPMSTVNAETMPLAKKIVPGDTILLCCDGLYNLVTDEEIKNILGKFPVQEAADNLVALANERGGNDNITVQVVRVLPERQQVEASENPACIIEQQYSRTEKDLKIQVDFDRIDVTLARIMVEPQLALPATDDFDDFPDYEDVAVQDDTDNETVEIETSPDIPSEPSLVSSDDSGDNFINEEAAEDGEIEISKDTASIIIENETEVSTEDINGEVSVSIEQTQPSENGSNGISRKIVTLAVLVSSLVVVMVLLVFVIRVGINSIPPPKSEIQKSLELAQQAENRSGVAQEIQEGLREKDLKTEPKPDVQLQGLIPSQDVIEKKAITYVSSDSLIPKDLSLSEEEKNKISELIAESSDFLIPESPSIDVPNGETYLRDPSPQEMEPISWNAERNKIEALQGQPTTAKVNVQDGIIAHDEAKAIDVLQPEELNIEEKRQIVVRKQSLRDKIFDLDAKLKVFGFQNIEESNSTKAQLENTLSNIYAAIDYKIKEKNYIQKSIEEFQIYQTQIKERGFEGVPTLPKIIERSRELIALYDAYNVSSSEYQQSLNDWKKNSSDATLSAKMVNKGNAIRVAHNKLTNALDDYLNLKLNSSKENYYIVAQELQDLEHRRDRINRQIGFVLAYSPNLSPRSRMVLQRELLDNRRLQEKEYKALSGQVSDEEERTLFTKALRSNPIIPE